MRKIKGELIHKARVKKQYSKIRERELKDQPSNHPSLYADPEQNEPDAQDDALPASLELHPDRQRMLDAQHTSPTERSRERTKQKRQQPRPFAKESAEADAKRESDERRRKEREEAEATKQRKLAERARSKKLMAKARSRGPNGQRKLGREGAVLLDRIQRQMAAE